MKKYFLWLLFAAFATTGYAASNHIALHIDGHAVAAEVASTPAQRSRGLMGRETLTKDHGMLFVFPMDDYYAMWMKDTPTALSVAFIDVNGKILNIAEMLPYTEESHFSAAPARFALEMPAGWFAAHHLVAGAKVTGLQKAPRARD